MIEYHTRGVGFSENKRISSFPFHRAQYDKKVLEHFNEMLTSISVYEFNILSILK